jgi:hypothetical protein
LLLWLLLHLLLPLLLSEALVLQSLLAEGWVEESDLFGTQIGRLMLEVHAHLLGICHGGRLLRIARLLLLLHLVAEV